MTDKALAEPNTCCCGHTSRCTCALKKDHLDTVPEDISPLHPLLPAVHGKDPHPHNRLSSLNSHESKLTVFANGHHKPVHKINDSHNKCGIPYKIPHKSHSIHGHREIAQRSSDSLPLTKAALTSHETPQHHESVTSAPQPVRKVKSEHGSPEIKPISSISAEPGSHVVIPPLDPNAYSYSPFSSGSPSLQPPLPYEHRTSEPATEGYYVSYEMANEWEPPQHSGGLSEAHPEVDWSQFNFDYNLNNPAYTHNNGVASSQPPSYASFDHYSRLSHPGLTSSSGELSEAEDFVPVNNPQKTRGESQDALNDFSSIGADESTDLESYRLSSASSYLGMPQTNMLAQENLNGLDIDEYLKQADAQTRQMSMASQQAQDQHNAMQQRLSSVDLSGPSKTPPGEHPFTVQEAQNYAHLSPGESAKAQKAAFKVPGTMDHFESDPMFSEPQPLMTPMLMMDDDDGDEGWVR